MSVLQTVQKNKIIIIIYIWTVHIVQKTMCKIHIHIYKYIYFYFLFFFVCGVELHWEGIMTVVCSTEAKDWESSVSGVEVRD